MDLTWLLDTSIVGLECYQTQAYGSNFFLNNTLEVHGELLVRYPKIIQRIYMGILVIDKTIIFIWLVKIMQNLDTIPKAFRSRMIARPKCLGSGSSSKFKALKSYQI